MYYLITAPTAVIHNSRVRTYVGLHGYCRTESVREV